MTYESDDPNNKVPLKWRTPLWTVPVLLLLVGLNLLFDYLFGTSTEHLMVEIAIQGLFIFTVVISLVHVWVNYAKEREQRLIKSNELEKVLTERIKPVHSFRENVDREFERWHLTPSERQIALLLLEGEDFKSIAQKRFTSEKTVRNQSRSIYEKAELSGRAALAAHFLKDLLHPEFNQHPPIGEE